MLSLGSIASFPSTNTLEKEFTIAPLNLKDGKTFEPKKIDLKEMVFGKIGEKKETEIEGVMEMDDTDEKKKNKEHSSEDNVMEFDE